MQPGIFCKDSDSGERGGSSVLKESPESNNVSGLFFGFDGFAATGSSAGVTAAAVRS